VNKIEDKTCENCQHAKFDSFADQLRCGYKSNKLVKRTDTCDEYKCYKKEDK